MSISPNFDRGPGIEGKWASINAEREALKEENERLKTTNKLLQDRVGELEAGLGMDYQQLAAAYAAAQHQIDELRAGVAKEAVKFTSSEQRAWDAIKEAFAIIAHEWKLKANHGELGSAVHTIQGFVLQHMLSRVSDGFGSWWESEEGKN